MGKGLEVLGGQVTAPGTTLTAWTMNSGNSLTIRNGAVGSDIKLINMWTKNQTDGILRVKSPMMHDNVQGYRAQAQSAISQSVWPVGYGQNLKPQDILSAEQTGSATAGDIEIGALLVYYDNLPGIDSRLIGTAELKGRMLNMLTVQNTLATGTSGGWSGEEAINADFDVLKANTDYAILGYVVETLAGSVRWRGADLGNLGVGGPCDPNNNDYQARYFVNLTEKTGIDLIPVFNSANKGALLMDSHQDENGTDVIVSTILAELAM